MQREEFIAIATKVAEGNADDQDKRLFIGHLNTFSMENPAWEKLDVAIRMEIQSELRNSIRNQIFVEVKKPASVKLWPRMAVAASIALVLSIGVYFHQSSQKLNTNPSSTYANDIGPGKNSATLTLANGQKINLSNTANGALTDKNGIKISKTADGKLLYEIKASGMESDEINTLSTARGETYQVRLPDGSMVWLNAASSITYATALPQHGQRLVKLNGEAYFEVAKDKAHPFIVQTSNQQVEVLGTHFNISAYSDDPFTKTTLLEGKVRLNKTTVLKPGDQAINEAGKIALKQIDVEEAIAWKEGKFVFNDESLESIMLKLSRWYGVNVVFKDEDMKNQKFWAKITRQDNLSKVLKTLEKTNMVKFQLQQKTVTVSLPNQD